MKRRSFLQQLGAMALAWLSFPACARSEKANATAENNTSSIANLDKPRTEWQNLLPAQAYAVLFEEVTERPGSSPLNHEKRDGTFVCAACYLSLFESKAKFESGTGWPSFFQPIPGHI